MGIGEHQGKSVIKSKGQFKYRVSYFWGFTASGDSLRPKILQHFPNAEITGWGNHFHSFEGGAKHGTSKDSYLWITFKIPS